MKILHILYGGLGGHGNVFFSMVASDRAGQNTYEALFFGVEGVRADFAERCNALDIPFSVVTKKPGLHIGYYRRLFSAIRKADAEIIFLHGSAYSALARAALTFSPRRKMLVVRETQANHLKSQTQWLALIGAMFTADFIVCLTGEFRDEIRQRLGILYRSKKVTVIANGIDTDLYQPHVHKQPGIIIGMQSRIVKIKDHATLLSAFGLLKDSGFVAAHGLSLRIAGDGETLPELILQRDALGLDEVEFTGMLDEIKLRDFLSEVDIYVHASFGETMSTAILQALACGLPIIASDVSGINNMIRDGEDGLLVPVQNAEALAAALTRLVEDPAFAAKLGAEARRTAEEKYSNHRMAREYQLLFERL